MLSPRNLPVQPNGSPCLLTQDGCTIYRFRSAQRTPSVCLAVLAYESIAYEIDSTIRVETHLRVEGVLLINAYCTLRGRILIQPLQLTSVRRRLSHGLITGTFTTVTHRTSLHGNAIQVLRADVVRHGFEPPTTNESLIEERGGLEVQGRIQRFNLVVGNRISRSYGNGRKNSGCHFANL